METTGYFFLRACVKEVHKERQIVAGLQACVESEKKALEESQKEQVRVKEAIRRNFIVALPLVMEDISPKNISIDTFSFSRVCDVAAREHISAETISLLVKRITHV